MIEALATRADRALAWFLAASDGDASWQRADRALVLHVLANHAPTFFATRELAPQLDDALTRLAQVPAWFMLDVPPVEALARVDAAYLRALHGLPAQLHRTLGPWLRHFAAAEPLFVWLAEELAATLGVARVANIPDRAFEGHEGPEPYWLTHRVLIATRYGMRRLEPGELATELAAIQSSASRTIERGNADLAAELALCLQQSEHHAGGIAAQLVTFVASRQSSTGAIEVIEIADPRRRAHATAVATLAFAGAVENDFTRGIPAR